MMKMSIAALVAAMTLAATSAALAQSAPMPLASTGPSMTVKLNAQNGSGETATAVLTPVAGGTSVAVKTAGGPMTAQPIHIHTGTCAKLDPKPAYPLTMVMNGSSMTFVKGVTPAQLMASPYAINIHKSPADLAAYVACGDITK